MNAATLASNSISYVLSQLNTQQRRLSIFELEADHTKEDNVTATAVGRGSSGGLNSARIRYTFFH